MRTSASPMFGKPMSRVLLATSILAVLPIAAGASSISVLQGLTGPAPSIIERGTPAEPQAETVTAKPQPTRAEINRVVTPMVMRGGVSGGPAPMPVTEMSAAETEIDADAVDIELE